jgi:hypothetical protein
MSSYKGSYAGIGKLMRSNAMKAEMVARAERVMARAVEIAPVYEGPDDRHRGRYKSRFSVTSTNRGGYKGNRAAGIVRNTDPAAFEIEVGTSRQLGHHTLRNALGAAGD